IQYHPFGYKQHRVHPLLVHSSIIFIGKHFGSYRGLWLVVVVTQLDCPTHLRPSHQQGNLIAPNAEDWLVPDAVIELIKIL
ncbi:uncharacterized protein MYCFIDRAFT_211312, partial [Pseudocercospora fijiensis CIRAD86]